MTQDSQPERKSSPTTAKLLTVVLVALVIQEAAQNHGHVDNGWKGALLIAIFFWAGASVDRYFR